MDIRQPCSFPRLFAESFVLVNKSFGAILVLWLCTFVAGILLGILTVLCKLPFFFVLFASFVLSCFSHMMLLRLFTARAENDNISLPDIAIAAVMPTIHIIIFSLLCGIATLILLFPFYSTSHYHWILKLLIFFLGLFLGFRFIYAPFAIAVREQGPISSLKYSWHMTGRHWLYTLGAVLIFIFFPLVVTAGVSTGLFVGIPLFFADSFSLAHPTWPWIIFMLLLVLLFICLALAMCAYLTLVFLHLDYEDNRGQLPADPMPQVQATPTVNASPNASNNIAGLQVEQASVKSHTEDEAVSQHLDQVYQAAPDVVEYAEEDRMPTILFDDDMAKEMEKNRMQWENEKSRTQHKDDDGSEPSTIKMSR